MAELSWNIVERHVHERGMAWYLVAVVVGVVLLIQAMVTRNFLFGFIIIMAAIVMITHSLRGTAPVRCAVTPEGIQVGERRFLWKDLSAFWMLTQPPEASALHLEFQGLRPRLTVPLDGVNPERVREALQPYVTEDTTHTEEPFSDWLTRVLKI